MNSSPNSWFLLRVNSTQVIDSFSDLHFYYIYQIQWTVSLRNVTEWTEACNLFASKRLKYGELKQRMFKRISEYLLFGLNSCELGDRRVAMKFIKALLALWRTTLNKQKLRNVSSNVLSRDQRQNSFIFY